MLSAFVRAANGTPDNEPFYLDQVEREQFKLDREAAAVYRGARSEYVSTMKEIFGERLQNTTPRGISADPRAERIAAAERKVNPPKQQLSLSTAEAKDFQKYRAAREQAEREGKHLVVFDPDSGQRVEIDGVPVAAAS